MPEASFVELEELESCSRHNPDVPDELCSRAWIAWRRASDDESPEEALGSIAKRLLCAWGEWPADAWDKETALHQAREWISTIGAGPYPPMTPEAAVQEAEIILPLIAETRARAGRSPSPITWPGEPLLVVYAVQRVWNDVLLFGRTRAGWTCFCWGTGA
jgi:hypothetical protein